MKLLVWNVQDAGGKLFCPLIKDMVKTHKPNIMALVEPRISRSNADKVVRKLGFKRSHRIEANGFASGIWLFWNNDEIHIDILLNRKQLMYTRIQCGDGSMVFTAIYASPQRATRLTLWKDLRALTRSIREPWLLAGDFNDMISIEDKKGGRFLVTDCVQDCMLQDLGFWGASIYVEGGSYTGENW